MRSTILLVLPCLLSVAGCPTSQTASPVTAIIGSTLSQGRAPLSVMFTASGSTSTNAGPLTYAWDFGDGSSSTQTVEAHTFNLPGRYLVKLTVTDSTGAQGVDVVEIKAAGAGVVAVISADVTEGSVPLVVHFDGTASKPADDTIYDYIWDFGDGSDQSRQDKPTHTFQIIGQYTVALQIVTAGGLEAHTSTVINAGKRVASLQFDGQALATLPIGSTPTVSTFTLEAWVLPENEGGTVLSLGDGSVTVDLSPSTNTIRYQVNGTMATANAASLTRNWRHLALVYDGTTTNTSVLYLDGAPIRNAATAGPVSADRLTIGNGFRGKIADVRVWSEARTAAAILSSKDHRLSGHENNLAGYWPVDDGSGQTLRNLAKPASTGTLGSSAAVDSADPAWSTDGPPL